ncbi:MAG: cell division protein ZapA [Janthinobacterium lividum]
MTQVNVTIMGQPYRLACREGEEDALQAAVNYLDQRMTSIRDAGKIMGNDRIAVMAALSISAELLATKTPDGPLSDMNMASVQKEISAMHAALDAALAPQEKLF